MESFNQSLKFLLQHETADFLRFGAGNPTIIVLDPVPGDLPSRGRDIDGGYLIERGAARNVAHIEFHRRHQSSSELAVDVAEAQIRLYRRELLPVVSQVWDLYGSTAGPLLEERTLAYGAEALKTGSRSVYLRVNLRALSAYELLTKGPPGLWPLVALTKDGATEEAVHLARDAIVGRKELSSTEQADHLAVLWFVAEAEDVPVKAMMVYISEERLMESSLYRSAVEKGEAVGEARGKALGRAAALAGMLVRILARRLGLLDPVLRERIRACSDGDALDIWCAEALDTTDAEAARRLAEKIQKVLTTAERSAP